MIIEYHRPKTLAEALELINREHPVSLPLGGGTQLNQPRQDAIAVVDLQSLGLGQLIASGNTLTIGAMVTLQALVEWADTPGGLVDTIQHEASINIRQAATIAGCVAAGDGRSPLLAALLAADAELEVQRAKAPLQRVKLGDWLPFRHCKRGELITAIRVPSNVSLAYQYVARTPADLPIIGAVVARWPSGRTRLSLCGWGAAPVLAMDGPEPGGLEAAAHNAASQADDAWASGEYRQAMAPLLAIRAYEMGKHL